MLGFTPRLPIPEPREQNNPAGLVMLGTPLHPAAPRGAVCNPLHPHPPVPAATPGNKTQREASPGMPESLLQGFFHSSNPSWKSLVRTVCGPNFPGPGAERDAGCAAQPRRWTSLRHSPPRSPEHPCAAVNWIFSSRWIYIRLPLWIYTLPPLWPPCGSGGVSPSRAGVGGLTREQPLPRCPPALRDPRAPQPPC